MSGQNQPAPEESTEKDDDGMGQMEDDKKDGGPGRLSKESTRGGRKKD